MNHDRIISREEIVGEAIRSVFGYDTNQDGPLSEAEYSSGSGSRSVMGGFIRGHAHELDRDSKRSLTRNEVAGNAERMLQKMDSNACGSISAEELAAARGE